MLITSIFLLNFNITLFIWVLAVDQLTRCLTIVALHFSTAYFNLRSAEARLLITFDRINAIAGDFVT